MEAGVVPAAGVLPAGLAPAEAHEQPPPATLLNTDEYIDRMSSQKSPDLMFDLTGSPPLRAAAPAAFACIFFILSSLKK
jgi:hypothetical protein